MSDRTLDEVIQGFREMGRVLQTPSASQMGGVNTPSYYAPATPSAASFMPPLPPPAPPPSFQMTDYSGVQQYQMDPMAAQRMAHLTNTPPLRTMNPQYMTGADYGAMRTPSLPSQMVNGFMNTNMSLMQLQPPMMPPSFHTVPTATQGHTQQTSMRWDAVDTLAMQNMGRTAIAGVGAWAGSGIGAAVGFGMGGMGGVNVGSSVGGILGAGLGISDTAADLTSWAMRPAYLRRAHAMRLGESSQRWGGISGGSLSPFGRGMSANASQDLVGRLDHMSDNTSGMNRTDMVNLTQMAGDTGILNMAQNPEQVAREMKNVIKAVGVIAKMTGDPDIRNAMRDIADMRSMGMSTPEITSAAHSAKQFARMAGVSERDLIQQGGAQGASIFQMSGMTGGTGLMMGMGAQGFTGSATAGGAFNPMNLSLYGGSSGVTQRQIEASGALMQGGLQALLPLLATKGGHGFEVNSGMLNNLRTGNFDINDLLRRSGGQMDSGQLQDLITRKPEVLEKVGRGLGPQGMLLAMGHLGKQMQEKNNLSSLGGGFRALGMDEKTSMMFEDMLTNRKFFENVIQQQQVSGQRAGMEEVYRRENMPGFFSQTWSNIKSDMHDMFEGPYDNKARRMAAAAAKRDAEAMGLEYLTFDGLDTSDAGAAFRRGAEPLANMPGTRNSWTEYRQGKRIKESDRYNEGKRAEENFSYIDVESGDTEMGRARLRAKGLSDGILSRSVHSKWSVLDERLQFQGLDPTKDAHEQRVAAWEAARASIFRSANAAHTGFNGTNTFRNVKRLEDMARGKVDVGKATLAAKNFMKTKSRENVDAETFERELAAAAGIPSDLANDPKFMATLMEQGMSSLRETDSRAATELDAKLGKAKIEIRNAEQKDSQGRLEDYVSGTNEQMMGALGIGRDRVHVKHGVHGAREVGREFVALKGEDAESFALGIQGLVGGAGKKGEVMLSAMLTEQASGFGGDVLKALQGAGVTREEYEKFKEKARSDEYSQVVEDIGKGFKNQKQDGTFDNIAGYTGKVVGSVRGRAQNLAQHNLLGNLKGRAGGEFSDKIADVATDAQGLAKFIQKNSKALGLFETDALKDIAGGKGGMAEMLDYLRDAGLSDSQIALAGERSKEHGIDVADTDTTELTKAMNMFAPVLEAADQQSIAARAQQSAADQMTKTMALVVQRLGGGDRKGFAKDVEDAKP